MTMIDTSDKTATSPNRSYHSLSDFPPTSAYLAKNNTEVSKERTEKNRVMISEIDWRYISTYNIILHIWTFSIFRLNF